MCIKTKAKKSVTITITIAIILFSCNESALNYVYSNFTGSGIFAPFANLTVTSIAVTSPNGGETWAGGTTQTIRWTYSGTPGSRVRIELMKNGVVNRTINSSTPVGSDGIGSYRWLRHTK